MSNSIDPDETAHMSHLIWIYAVCKNLLPVLLPVAVKELMLVWWVKISFDNILEYISYFSQKIGFDIHMQVVSLRDTLHECKILFLEKKRKNINNLSFSAFVHSMFSVNLFPRTHKYILRGLGTPEGF